MGSYKKITSYCPPKDLKYEYGFLTVSPIHKTQTNLAITVVALNLTPIQGSNSS